MVNWGVCFLLTVVLLGCSGCNYNSVAAEQASAIKNNNIVAQAPTAQDIETKGINVKQFGAQGNDMDDDTAAFQKALDSLSGGQILRVPVGVYKVDRLLVPANVVMVGDKGAVLKGITEGAAILVIGAHDVTICGLILDGDMKSKQAIKINEKSFAIHIESCEIKNTYGDDKAGSWAVAILKGGKNITIVDCYFHNISGPENGIDGDNIGANRAIIAYDVESMLISKCTFEEISGFEDGDCIQINAQAIVDDNKWKYSDVTIQDCTFKNFYKRAIKVQASGVKIIHNSMSGNPASNVDKNFQAAISIFGGDNVIDNNTILLYGARLGVDLNGVECKVINNTITVDPTGSSKKTTGIYVASTGSRSVIENNTISHIPGAIEVNQETRGVKVKNNIVQ